MSTMALRLARTCGTLALLLGGVASGIAWAQADDFATPPRPAAPRPLRIDAPVEQRLPNGLRVVLAQRRGVQLVTAQLIVHASAGSLRTSTPTRPPQ